MMRDSISLGIVHPATFQECISGEGPLLETVSTILEDDFFDAIEVSWVRDLNVALQVSEALAASEKDVVFAGAIAGSIFGLNLSAKDDEIRGRSLKKAKSLIHTAHLFSARVMYMVSGPDPGEGKREASRTRLVESLKELCAQAEKFDPPITITLENGDREVERNMLIGPTCEAVEVSELVREDFDNFGLTMDLTHFPLLGEDPMESLELAKGHIKHAHIGNCVTTIGHELYGDKHPRFGIEGGSHGVEEVADFLNGLKKVGYLNGSVPSRKPIVSMEVIPIPPVSPGQVIMHTKGILKKVFESL